MSERVCAIVVTYNRAGLLRACLAALGAQTRAPDAILVVDNASTDGTRALLRAEFPEATVLALVTNQGGAGGFHQGMKWAYGRGFDWLWVMDDDAHPAPDCLAKLVACCRPNAVLVPVQQDSGGRCYGFALWRNRYLDVTADIVAQGQPVGGNFVFHFVGPLIAREVVARIGLPNKEFFIWFDDIEYALRIQSGMKAEIIAVPDALVRHDFGSQPREASFLGRRSIRNLQHAPWKLYYGTRNNVYTLIWTRRNLRELFLFLWFELRFLSGELVYEPDRWERLRMRLLGLRDALIGRLGKRV